MVGRGREGQRYCWSLEIQACSPWTLHMPTADSTWPSATYRCGCACDLTQSSLEAGRSVDQTADMQTHCPGYLWSWEGFLVHMSCLQNAAFCFPIRSLQAWHGRLSGRELRVDISLAPALFNPEQRCGRDALRFAGAASPSQPT